MKVKAATLALFAVGLLTGLTLIGPATGADGTTTTPTTTTTGSTTSSTPTTTTTQKATTGAQDTLTALSSTSVTVGSLTCAIGPSSPAVTFKVGDRVKIYCTSGVLAYIFAGDPPPPTTTAPPPPPPPATTTTSQPNVRNATGAQDAISALTSTSITVGPLTCAIGPSSPAVTFKLGDRVKIYCLDGVLGYIFAGDPLPAATTPTTTTAPPPPPRHGDDGRGNGAGAAPPQIQTRLGSIAAVGGGSITVDGLTCTVGASSPGLAGYSVGDDVGIGCANNVLVKLGLLQSRDDSAFKLAVRLGPVVSLGDGTITVGPLTCQLATTSPSVASFHVGDKVGVGCAGGILFMIGALPATPDSATPSQIKQELVQRFTGCVKRGAERCVVADVLRRAAHAKQTK